MCPCKIKFIIQRFHFNSNAESCLFQNICISRALGSSRLALRIIFVFSINIERSINRLLIKISINQKIY